MAEHAFVAHVRDRVRSSLLSISPGDRPEIYAVSLYIDEQADMTGGPLVTVGYNTERSVQAAVADGAPDDEARWNYAYWLQNELGTIADPDSDPASVELHAGWRASLGFAPGQDYHWRDLDRALKDLLVSAVQDLHARGIVTRALGRPVPLIVHELEYSDETLDDCDRANPPGLGDGLRASLKKEYGDSDLLPPPDDAYVDDGPDESELAAEELAKLAALAPFSIYVHGARPAKAATLTEHDRPIEVETDDEDTEITVHSALASAPWEQDPPTLAVAEAAARAALWRQLWTPQGLDDEDAAERASTRSDQAVARPASLLIDGDSIAGIAVDDPLGWAIGARLNEQTVAVRGPNPRPAALHLRSVTAE